MAGIRLEWAQFGDFDTFDVIRSDTSLAAVADVDLPSPIATGLTTMYYADTTVVEGAAYYYKVRVWRDGTSVTSNEIEIDAIKLGLVYLKFHQTTTLDYGTGGVVWTAFNSPTIVNRSIYFNGLTSKSYLAANNNILNFGVNSFFIEFEIKLLNGNPNTYMHVLSGESTNSWNNAIQLYVRHTAHAPLVGLERDYNGANYPCKSTIGSIPYDVWCKVRFERNGTSLKVFINDILNNSITIPSTLPYSLNMNGMRIGSASWDTSAYLNAYLRKLHIDKL